MTTGGSKFNDGSTWALAVDLPTALAAPAICTEVWVAKGVYKPSAVGDTAASFQPGDAVAVYGGFAGTEDSRDQRDAVANLTVLSGDVDNNDTVNAGGVDVDTTHIVGSNSAHVVKIGNTFNAPVMDGFTITGGDARPGDGSGGGLQCFGQLIDCKVALSNMTFRGNIAYQGGALFVSESHHDAVATVSDSLFISNRATLKGGAIAFVSTAGSGALTVTQTTFQANGAGEGGAVYVFSENIAQSTTTLSHVAFVGNGASSKGGALSTLDTEGSDTHILIDNTTFLSNHSTLVAAGALFQSTWNGNSPQLNFVTFNDNQAETRSGAIEVSGSALNVAIYNSILWGNRAPLGFGPEISFLDSAKATFDHSVVQGSGGSAAWNAAFGIDAGGNVDADPLLGSDYGLGRTPSLMPRTGSPAIDAGNDAFCTNDDQRGVLRPQGAHCDIGAAEAFVLDLIGHKSFQACWSTAVTQTAFLDAIRAQVDGVESCVAPVVNASYSSCNTPACPGGAMGCKITSRAPAFTGSFADGVFSATGSVDDVDIPVQVTSPFARSCTYHATGIVGDYVASYLFTDDGNFGDQAALLERFAATPSGYTISSDDSICDTVSASISPAIVNAAKDALRGNLGQKVRDATQGKAVCPAP